MKGTVIFGYQLGPHFKLHFGSSLQRNQHIIQCPHRSRVEGAADPAVGPGQGGALCGGLRGHGRELQKQHDQERDQAEVHGGEGAHIGGINRGRKAHDHAGRKSAQENQLAQDHFLCCSPHQIKIDHNGADEQQIGGQRYIFCQMVEVFQGDKALLKHGKSVKLGVVRIGKKGKAGTDDQRNGSHGAVQGLRIFVKYENAQEQQKQQQQRIGVFYKMTAGGGQCIDDPVQQIQRIIVRVVGSGHVQIHKAVGGPGHLEEEHKK